MIKRETVSIWLFFTLGIFSNLYSFNQNQPDTLILKSDRFYFHPSTKSKIPLFKFPVDSIFEFTIKTDFDKINSTEKKNQTRIDGTLSYIQNGSEISLPIRIKARGNTRFEYCQYKPLDIKFSYDLKETIFEGLQDKISIVTHCGKKEGEQWIFEASESEYKDKLFAEYYLYSFLEELNSITRSVSLCNIKYVNSNDSILTENYAFVLEPYAEVAKRCGLERNKEKVVYISESALLGTQLMNQFITNYDWKYEYSDSLGWTGHNLKFLMSKDSVFYPIPYDFDLTALMYPEYWKNKTESFDDHCNRFYDFVAESFAEENKLSSLYQLYSMIPKIKEIIKESYLDAEMKNRFEYWIESYEFIIYEHLIMFKNFTKFLE